MAFELNGRPHFLTYRSTGLTARAAFELGGRPHFLVYRLNSGRVSITRIEQDEITLQILWGDTWAPDWTRIVSFVLNGQPHLLSYKGGTP
jgi:hypothetical protein